MSEVILAPLAGITDKPFRQMVRQFGHQMLFTEMLGATPLVRGSDKTMNMMDIHDEISPIGIQIVGFCPQDLARAAVLAEKAGACEVNINMGCPMKKLISNGSGAVLMQMPDMAFEMVKAVKQVIKVPLSVKTRLGWTDITAVEFAKVLESAGADKVIIHGRTRAQMYSGKANWAEIAKVKKALSIPVIANGDIIDEKSAEECLRITGADGIMIGRGALGKPWLLNQIQTNQKPSFILLDVVMEHFERLLAYYGEYIGLRVARKHLAWYASGIPGVAEFRKTMFLQEDKDVVRRMIVDFFGKV